MFLTKKEIQKIWEHHFFSGLDRALVLPLLEEHGCSVRVYCAGDVILSPDSPAPLMGLILEGEAIAKTSDPSNHTLLRTLAAGDVFGVANLFSTDSFVSHITANKESRVFVLPKGAVSALMAKSQIFLEAYLSFVCSRVCYLNKKITYLTAGSAERRLAVYLASFDSEEIVLSESLSSLSDLLNLGRASLYRAFDRLSLDGYIQRDARRITVLKKDAMLKAYE